MFTVHSLTPIHLNMCVGLSNMNIMDMRQTTLSPYLTYTHTHTHNICIDCRYWGVTLRISHDYIFSIVNSLTSNKIEVLLSQLFLSCMILQRNLNTVWSVWPKYWRNSLWSDYHFFWLHYGSTIFFMLTTCHFINLCYNLLKSFTW